MRLAVVIFYIGILFVLTCTESFLLLITDQKINFQLNNDPNFANFILIEPSSFQDPTYITQKIGHFLSFFFLAYLILWALNNLALTVWISVSYAIVTEILQLFFSRNGQLLDVVYDVFGVMVLVGGCFIYRRIRNNEHLEEDIRPARY